MIKNRRGTERAKRTRTTTAETKRNQQQSPHTRKKHHTTRKEGATTTKQGRGEQQAQTHQGRNDKRLRNQLRLEDFVNLNKPAALISRTTPTTTKTNQRNCETKAQSAWSHPASLHSNLKAHSQPSKIKAPSGAQGQPWTFTFEPWPLLPPTVLLLSIEGGLHYGRYSRLTSEYWFLPN